MVNLNNVPFVNMSIEDSECILKNARTRTQWVAFHACVAQLHAERHFRNRHLALLQVLLENGYRQNNSTDLLFAQSLIKLLKLPILMSTSNLPTEFNGLGTKL